MWCVSFASVYLTTVFFIREYANVFSHLLVYEVFGMYAWYFMEMMTLCQIPSNTTRFAPVTL